MTTNTGAVPSDKAKIINAPDRLFLNVGLEVLLDDADFSELDEVTWCAEAQSSLDIEYVRVGAAASEVQADHIADERKMVYPDEFTDDLRWILGLICFQCVTYAQVLRKVGRAIPNKAEAEQAATLDWMLRHYLRDPLNWRNTAADEMRAWNFPASSTGDQEAARV